MRNLLCALCSLLVALNQSVAAADNTKPAADAKPPAGQQPEAPKPAEAPKDPKAETPKKETPAADTKEKPAAPSRDKHPSEEEKEAGKSDDKEPGVAKAMAVPSDPKQVYGWREDVIVGNLKTKLKAKLDTGARTCSLHAIEQKIFERDGEKWVSFVTSETRNHKAKIYRLEAPLVRTTMVKEPAKAPVRRNVVRLSFKIGDRKIRADFTLNDRGNMICPVLIGRSALSVLGWVDPSRRNLANEKILR